MMYIGLFGLGLMTVVATFLSVPHVELTIIAVGFLVAAVVVAAAQEIIEQIRASLHPNGGGES